MFKYFIFLTNYLKKSNSLELGTLLYLLKSETHQCKSTVTLVSKSVLHTVECVNTNGNTPAFPGI